MRDARDRKTKICHNCGQPMWRGAKVCKKCVQRSGEHNSNWRGGIANDTSHYRKIQAERYPQKALARAFVKAQIKSGNIIRQPCEICGALPTDAHHEDYSKPLEVRWLCKKHHREAHNGMRWYRAEGQALIP